MELFGTNNPKGADDVTAGEKLLPGVTGQKEDAARTAFKEKERGCTIRPFGTNSLKKGAV
jgi:predicted molibdopterin-dependent oxidoreductase YjgC